MCVRICDEANGKKKAAPRPPLHTMGRPFFPPPHAKSFVDLRRARFFSASCKSRPKKKHTQKVEGHKGMIGSVSHATDPVLVLLRPCTCACSLPSSAFHYTTPHTCTHTHTHTQARTHGDGTHQSLSARPPSRHLATIGASWSLAWYRASTHTHLAHTITLSVVRRNSRSRFTADNLLNAAGHVTPPAGHSCSSP